jgi:hypothetical protein
MGYTCGRKHTDESLREIASNYKTRTDLQMGDPSVYRTALLRGREFLDSICSHMVKGKYSTPQLICKHIMEKITGEVCMYDTKKIVPPYELDVYFPNQKFAVEYNGKGWHHKDEVIKRDTIKKDICKSKNITLLVIVENSRNYEEDVKNQIISNLKIINEKFITNITEYDVLNVECNDVYDFILEFKDIDSIKNKIAKCKNISDFQRKHITEYNFIQKNGHLHLLDCIRERIDKSDEELIEECKKIDCYSTLLAKHSKLYHACHRRGMLELACKHMKKSKRKYKNYNTDTLLEMAAKFFDKSDILKSDISLHYEIKQRGKELFDTIQYKPRPLNKNSKKYKTGELFKLAERYDNYEDFKNDQELFNKCKKYQIINKIVDSFPKPDMESIIMEKSTEYLNFEEFIKSSWYLKSKRFKGLTSKIKKRNGWSCYTTPNKNFIAEHPDIVTMINAGKTQTEISKITGINVTTIWRVKKKMKDVGILEVADNFRS